MNPQIHWLLRANNERKAITPANGKAYSLEECQGYVGGYIEVVGLHTPTAWRNYILLVDEDGLSKGLKPNYAATTMAGHVIVGDAMLIPSRALE